MQVDISVIVDATRKASRFLQRDYFELENLQSSDKKNTLFCQKSCGKILQILQETLSKYYKTIIFDNKEAQKLNFHGSAALVEVLDGFGNLERSLPFFAIMVTILSKKGDKIITEKSVMNFPALGEIYYTGKGKGSWVERHNSNFPGASRIRVSGNGDAANALISTTPKHIDKALKISQNIRLFESYTYSTALLVSGKVDIFITEPRAVSSAGVKLFVEEAGGVCELQDGLLLASNARLSDKIKG